MKTLLIERYLDAGLIQFGWFEHRESVKPVAFKLEMLTSYPELLLRSAQELIRLAGETQFSHLLTPSESIGLGTAVALEMAVPLVYQRTTDETQIDLVGAYDIGHPAVLVLDVFDRQHPPRALIAHARRVGLEVNHVYCLIDIENGANPLEMYVSSVMTLRGIVERAAADGLIPPGQADVVREWINRG